MQEESLLEMVLENLLGELVQVVGVLSLIRQFVDDPGGRVREMEGEWMNPSRKKR